MTIDRGSADPRAGEHSSEGDLTDALYEELRDLARRSAGRLPGTVDATDIVHSAWLRISDRYAGLTRTEFLALSATVMRRLAVDEARRLEANGGPALRITRSGPLLEDADPTVDVLALDRALAELQDVEPRWAHVVELLFFGGMTQRDTAIATHSTLRTVERDWALARAWLKGRLEGRQGS